MIDCEEEIICDLAETYHILNYRELSPSLVATLVLGLDDNSRLKRKLSGHKLTLNQMLMALMVDNLQFLAWTKTKSASKGQNRPESLYNKLMGLGKKEVEELNSFETPEAFELWMESKREEWKKNG